MILSNKNVFLDLKKGEGHQVEFKTSFGKEVIESVVAFSNSEGGKIYIGVSDSGAILGLTALPETIPNYINTIKQNTQPSIIVDIESLEVDKKIIVVIDVKEYPIKPIAYKNRYYKRSQNSNHLMSLNEIANEHLKTINASWDYLLMSDMVLAIYRKKI